MQRNKGSNNESHDKKDEFPTAPGGPTGNITTELTDTPALDCSEQAEDKDIATLTELMKPLAAQLYPPVQMHRGRPVPVDQKSQPVLSEADKAAIEEKKQIPTYIKEFLMNPAFLEEYARDEYSTLVTLGRIPNKVIGEYLGYTPEYIASLLTSEAPKQQETIAILRRMRNRLVAQAEVDRQKAAPQTEKMLIDLLMTDVEHPELALMDTMSKMEPNQRARAVAVFHQYWKAGYFAIHQPESTLYRVVETHFGNYAIKPEAATCVFSGLVPLSSNAVPANPLCWMHDVIVQISPGMHSKVVTYVKGGVNMKVMTSVGIDHTEYQKFHGKMATPKLVETKNDVQFDATKGSEATNVGAAHVVSKSAREAMLDGVFKYLPTPEPILIPEDHVLIFVSFQTDAWFDYIIKSSNGDYAAWNQTLIRNKLGENLVIHSSDFVTPPGIDGDILELNKKDRAYPRKGGSGSDNNQIVLYIPQKPGREPSHHHFAAAAYGATFDEKIRTSCYAFSVKLTQSELDNLQSYLVTRNVGEASKLVKRVTMGLKPLFELRSTKPYADAKASGVEPLSVSYDGQRTTVNIWGLPLNFGIMAAHGATGEWGKLMIDLDRVVGLDHNKVQRQVLVDREKKAAKQPSKVEDAKAAISIQDLADKHDTLREITAQLITNKIESKEQESLILNPAMLCYQTLRQEIVNQISPQLMGCYIRAELEAEMIQREKDRVAEVKKSVVERRQLNAVQVGKEVAQRQKADPSVNVLQLTQELLAKKEAELNQQMVERKELNLHDFYQVKFKEDLAVLKMDPTQGHRAKLLESIRKLAQDKMSELKGVIQPLLDEDDADFNRAVSLFQNGIKDDLNAFFEEEAKARDERQESPKVKAEREAREAKENPADKETRLAKEAAEKAVQLANRKEALAKILQEPIKHMVEIISEKIAELGFANLASEKQLTEKLVNYLWSVIESKYQARCASALRGLFKGKLPLNETDISEETIDAKTELSRLANISNATLFDCTVKQQELHEMIKNPDVIAKIGKFTAFAFSIFKVSGEEVSAAEVVQSGAPRARYLKRTRRTDAV